MYLLPCINYTIVMDRAPGPNIFIGVVPNPVFTSINPNDLTQEIGSAKIIRINVCYIIAIQGVEVTFSVIPYTRV